MNYKLLWYILCISVCAVRDIILIVENKTYCAVNSPPLLRNILIK